MVGAKWKRICSELSVSADEVDAGEGIAPGPAVVVLATWGATGLSGRFASVWADLSPGS